MMTYPCKCVLQMIKRNWKSQESLGPGVGGGGGGGGTPILDLTGMLVVTFRGSNCGSGNF